MDLNTLRGQSLREAYSRQRKQQAPSLSERDELDVSEEQKEDHHGGKEVNREEPVEDEFGRRWKPDNVEPY